MNAACEFALKVQPLNRILLKGMKIKVTIVVPHKHARVEWVPLEPGETPLSVRAMQLKLRTGMGNENIRGFKTNPRNQRIIDKELRGHNATR